MNHPIDDLNRFLDDGLPTPANNEQREIAAIVGRLSTAQDPDSVFLKGLERQLTAAKPNSNLVPLPVVERVNSRARPWRASVSTYSAAALLVVIVAGALLGGWLFLPNRDSGTNRQIGVASVPTTQAFPGAALVRVVRPGAALLYAEPSSQSASITTIGTTVELIVLDSRLVGGESWIEVSIPGTTITGWMNSLDVLLVRSSVHGNGELGSPTADASEAKPEQGFDRFKMNESVKVTKPVNVWSMPGVGMVVVGKVNQYEQLWVAGPTVNYNGSEWTPVRTSKTETPAGWVFADELLPAPTPQVTAVIGSDPRPYLSLLHTGVGATVFQEIRVWSEPGKEMKVVWTAETSDHFTVTGEPISYNNADWTSIGRRSATTRQATKAGYWPISSRRTICRRPGAAER
jgi:hypothetical protein